MPRLEALVACAPALYSPDMSMANAAKLEIKLFGGLEVRLEGEMIPLPQSKKTRALLAYLILKGTPQRRDALCQLLWDIPDDPRAALRWSLSKLRPVVNDDGIERLTADRERVAFAPHGAVVDILRAEEACTELQHLSRGALLDLCSACSESFLAGLDLPSHPAYEAWRLGQQDKARRLHLRVIDELLAREKGDAAEHTSLLRRRVELDPDNQDAHLHLIAHLAVTGRRSDVDAQAAISRRMLAEGGRPRARAIRALPHRAGRAFCALEDFPL